MKNRRYSTWIFVSATVVWTFCLATAVYSHSDPRVKIKIVADEAEAVLQLLAKRAASQEIVSADWERIFRSEGYLRLQQRERSMNRSFEDADFKILVLSDNLLQQRVRLANALGEWQRVDLSKIAKGPLSYLPSNAKIHTKIYPVIKPKQNSFVFGLPEDPAIFIYIDPDKPEKVFENEVAHELHHIGYGTVCPPSGISAEIASYPSDLRRTTRWIGAFGEGFAMLAAAGSPDTHPHRFSSDENRKRWDRDIANFNEELKKVEEFFLNLLSGRLSENEEMQQATSFYGIQGPWYTVGWQMSVVIEKVFGRKKLIATMCGRKELLSTYNKALGKYNHRYKSQLNSWSPDLIRRLNPHSKTAL